METIIKTEKEEAIEIVKPNLLVGHFESFDQVFSDKELLFQYPLISLEEGVYSFEIYKFHNEFTKKIHYFIKTNSRTYEKHYEYYLASNFIDLCQIMTALSIIYDCKEYWFTKLNLKQKQ